jgi:hypothetical protein
MSPSRYLKAIVGAVISALTAAQVALDSGHPVTTTQWVTLGIGALVATLGVYAVPNTPATFHVPSAAPADPGVLPIVTPPAEQPPAV